jgi:hypothetical protein
MGMEPPEIMITVRARSPKGSAEWERADKWLKEWEAQSSDDVKDDARP